VHASSLTEPQIQTLLLTNAVTNASEWAVAFHTALALKQGVLHHRTFIKVKSKAISPNVIVRFGSRPCVAWRCLRVERAMGIEPTPAPLPELENNWFRASQV
jgi:hypothetical protein